MVWVVVYHNFGGSSIKELLTPSERKDLFLEALCGHFAEHTRYDILKEGANSSIFRLRSHRLILKVSTKSRTDLEAVIYEMLQQKGIPSICNNRLTDYVISSEDILTTDNWRFATKFDIQDGSVGYALAEWIKDFHTAGRELLLRDERLKDFFKWEYDYLTPETLNLTEKKFSFKAINAWKEIRKISEKLVEKIRPEVDAITYNDFFYGNMVVGKKQPIGQRVVALFDFDHTGKGIAESDYRNIMKGLHGEALRRFRQEIVYDNDLMLIDNLLSVIYALIKAAERETIPDWAQGLVVSVKQNRYQNLIERIKTII